ncbi:MAG: hypothetical protein E7813_16030 [Bradyrhizobium sp.]|nr:MAG: hypothetical protein E7813_16030 [Bradyrhizobium sp.]
MGESGIAWAGRGGRSVTIESQIARRSPRTTRCLARRRRRLNLKIARPISPANDSAPTTAISSIRIERDCFSEEDESAAASETAAAATGGLVVGEFDGAVTPGFSTASAGLADDSTLDGSGQREATTDGRAFASGGLASGLFSGPAALAGAAGTGGQTLASVLCSTRVCGGSSARASAIESRTDGSAFDGAGLAVSCEDFSPSRRRYQQCRLLG